ncbi:MAG: hypothetical protein FJ267_06835, partial [Planctomycetes bacterium]|nr:hypothetical protein [Planctomycetota bacterium]
MPGRDAMLLRDQLISRFHRSSDTIRQAMESSLFPFTSAALVGVLLVSSGIPWLLTWGAHPEFAVAALVMSVLGLILSRTSTIGQRLSWPVLSVAACGWVLLQPVVLHVLTQSLRQISYESLESTRSRFLLAQLAAVPVWCVSSFLWSRLIQSCYRFSQAGPSSSSRPTVVDPENLQLEIHSDSFREAIPAVASGLGAGIFLNAFVLSVFWGVSLASLFSLMVAVGIWRLLPILASPIGRTQPFHNGVSLSVSQNQSVTEGSRNIAWDQRRSAAPA